MSPPASPAVPRVVSSQYHSQDEQKNFAFGYSNINSARHEAGNAYTGVAGRVETSHWSRSSQILRTDWLRS